MLIMYATIKWAARAFGKNEYSNDEFIKKYSIDSSDEWIVNMTGIKKRYIIEDSDDFELMITSTVKSAANGEQIDGIIVASSTNFYRFPGLSQLVHRNLEYDNNVRTLDVNGACNGFMQALAIANSWIQNENMNNVIVVGADAMSSILDMNDRSTNCLFGDGVGAVLLSKSETEGIISFEHATISKNCEALVAKDHIIMNGRAVFDTSKVLTLLSYSKFLCTN